MAARFVGTSVDGRGAIISIITVSTGTTFHLGANAFKPTSSRRQPRCLELPLRLQRRLGASCGVLLTRRTAQTLVTEMCTGCVWEIAWRGLLGKLPGLP